MSRESVLSLLLEQQGTYISGEEMSRKLGVSRAAIWKTMTALRQDGYHIASASNRGYCLEESPDRLREGELTGPLAGCEIGSTLLCLETIDSTNTEAKRRALDGAPHGLVILSEEQTGGRGRAGRSFHSPRDCGLYCSVLFRPTLPPAEVMNFTAWVAVAVCDGIEQCCGIRPQIKWTNDLILGNKKLCGILTELGFEGETHSLDYLIAGIGINVNHNVEDFSTDIQDMATSLSLSLGRPVRRTELAICLIRALNDMYAQFPTEKERYLKQYRADCITVGKNIQLITPTTRREAVAISIDDEFRLVVEHADGSREAISTGEVSVRGMHGYV